MAEQQELERISKRLEHLKESRNPIYQIFPNFRERQIQKTLNQYEKQMKIYQEKNGTVYQPEQIATLRYKKSAYRIPDDLCRGDFNREMRKELEDYCKENKIEIPMEIGKKVEEEFRKGRRMWIHRTQIGADYTKSLSEIGKKGLICEQSDLENTATPLKNYTMLMQQLVASWKYRQGSCKGVILIRTEEEPKITDKKLDPSQIIGYIGNDHGNLHSFISREQMCQMQPTLESFQEKQSEKFQDFNEYLKQQIADVPENNRGKSSLNREIPELEAI